MTKSPHPRHGCGTILEPHCDNGACAWTRCIKCGEVEDGHGGRFVEKAKA